MSYLGRGLEQVDNISKLDNITFNGGTTYALTKDSSAFTPISSNAILISVSGVIQQGNFTVSGTNIVFNTAVASSETCDFIMHYGQGVAFTPADSSITKDKTNFVSTGSGYSGSGLDIKGDGSANGRLGLLCSNGNHGVALESPNHSDSMSYTIQLPSNAPTANKFIKVTSLTGSGSTAIAHTQFAGAGIEKYFLVHRSGDFSFNNNTWTKVQWNSVQQNTGMTWDSSNYRLTPGATGIYHFINHCAGEGIDNEKEYDVQMYKNGSSAMYGNKYWYSAKSNSHPMVTATYFLKVSSATDYFETYVYTNNSTNEHVAANQSYFACYKIGDI